MALMQLNPVLPLLIIKPNSWPYIYRTRQRAPLGLNNYMLSGWRGLMAAVVSRAWEEASAGDLDALGWLVGEDCFSYCMALGYDHNIIRSWVKKTRERFRKMDEKIIELRKKIAAKKGLPGIFAEWLRGEDEKSISEDAEKLIKFIRPGIVDLDNFMSMTPAEIRANSKALLEKASKG